MCFLEAVNIIYMTGPAGVGLVYYIPFIPGSVIIYWFIPCVA